MNKLSNFFKNPINWVYISASLIVISLLAVVYGIFRGVDWTDESWAYSLTSSGRVSVGEPWAFQYLLHPVLIAIGDHLIAIRFIRLFSFLILGLLIAGGFGLISKSTGNQLSKTSWIILICTTQVGTVLAWSWPPRYFAYNEINSVVVQIVAISIATLLFLERSNSHLRFTTFKFLVAWSGIGLFVGILFYGRFTGFLMLAPIAFIATFFSGKGRRLFAALLFSLFTFAGVVIPFALGLPIAEYLSSIWINITDAGVRAANNHPSGLVQMYAENLWGTFLSILPVMILGLSGILLSTGTFDGVSKSGIFRKSGYLFLALTGVITLIYVLQSGGGAERTGKIAIVNFGLAAVAFFVYANSKPATGSHNVSKVFDSWRIFVAIALIGITPIVASFGTNNPLSLHFGFDATIWTGAAGLAIAIGYEIFSKNHRTIWVPSLAMLLVALMAGIAIVGEARLPYRSASFKANSELVTDSGPFQGIYVTPSEKNWLSWLNKQSKEMSAENVPTLSLKSAGALLAFNNSSFASPWLESFWPASFWSISRACEEVKPKDLIVLVPGTVPEGAPEWNDLASTLKKSCGISFPSDFIKVSQRDAIDPTYAMTIWRIAN